MRKLVCLIGLLCFMPTVSTATPIDVYVDPSKSHAAPGEMFDIYLLADIPVGGLPLIGFGVNFFYDTDVISFTGATAGSDWFLGGFSPNSVVGFGPGVTGMGVLLATLTFTAADIPFGSTPITLSEFPFPGAGFPFPDLSFADVNFQHGLVAVPEPNTTLLLGIGLLALGWMHRRRRLPLAP